jgi:hypothetical protein
MPSTPLTNIQAAILAAVTQLIALGVALGWLDDAVGKAIVTAAGSVIALGIGIYQLAETGNQAAAALNRFVSYKLGELPPKQ